MLFRSHSKLLLTDFDSCSLHSIAEVEDSSKQYTFPTFSPDGKSIYFCQSTNRIQPDSVAAMHYSICRIGFDVEKGQFMPPIDTIWSGNADNGSASFPKISPDGKYLLFCVADYGTFPIWHRETDLKLMDLTTGKVDPLTEVNSDRSDTYHAWSSNGRWFVFASKRDDGLYGKPYFSYVDTNGIAHKAFVLPQADPEFYDITLKSFNIPELSATALPFTAKQIQKIYHEMPAEPFNLHTYE